MNIKKLLQICFLIMLIMMIVDQVIAHIQGNQDLIADTIIFKISFIGMAVFGTGAILVKGKEK